MPSSILDTDLTNEYSRCMEPRDALRQRVRQERQLKTRLQLATTRLEDAERERVWAIVAAHEAGLSIRKIAAATGLSRSRIHQLLQDEEAREIPEWLTHLRARDISSEAPADTDRPSADAVMKARVADEVEVLRWCIDWLERLGRGEMVVVNLRPDTEDEHEFVPFDQARVLRVLARIASDFDALTHNPSDGETASPKGNIDPRTRHRRRLAVPDEPPRGRTAKEQRDAIRKAAGLPPYHGDYADYVRGTS
jgi:AraC-like DNA-binding protein